MSKVRKAATAKSNVQLPTLHPHAAGIDVGAAQLQVAVPCDADPQLAGERDGHKLAQLKDHRIKASGDVIARSLVGDWRTEHLFALRQALATWRHYQTLLTECDTATAQALTGFESRVDMSVNPPPPSTLRHKKPHANEPRFEA